MNSMSFSSKSFFFFFVILTYEGISAQPVFPKVSWAGRGRSVEKTSAVVAFRNAQLLALNS